MIVSFCCLALQNRKQFSSGVTTQSGSNVDFLCVRFLFVIFIVSLHSERDSINASRLLTILGDFGSAEFNGIYLDDGST